MKTVNSDILSNLNSNSIVLQVCNNKGAMGAGLSGYIADKYPIVEDVYRLNAKNKKLVLGSIIPVKISPGNSNSFVVNLICQNDYSGKHNSYLKNCFVDLDDFMKCLSNLVYFLNFGKLPINSQDYICNFPTRCWTDLSQLDIRVPYKMASNRGGANWEDIVAILDTWLKGNYTIYSIEGNN